MQVDTNLIQRCQNNDATAQKVLYDKYSSLFFAICLRYMKNDADAEDLLVESFYKIFSKIGQFKDEGSFEGWMKRIVVNECLMALRKSNNLRLHVDIDEAYNVGEESTIESEIQYEEILELMQQLPVGYKTVFNLYVLEGYKHKEIADILEISINTSKSQLILAKKKMRELYKKKQEIKIS